MTTLTSQLNDITASIPAEIGVRIQNGVDDVTSSGVAPGLAVGDVAPGFTLNDAVGNRVVLADLLAEGPVVLTFYRGEWCPYCNLQLRALQEALPDITSAGATLVAISPQAPDHGLTMTEKHELAFPVLSDVDQTVSEAYKVRFDVTGDLEDLQVNVFQNDPAKQNANGQRTLPVPSTFIIGRDGTVRFASINADWRVRVDPADLIAFLKAL
ncbi:MAG: peroxiredoxin-like family protein [Acidimicrobiales bacterium]